MTLRKAKHTVKSINTPVTTGEILQAAANFVCEPPMFFKMRVDFPDAFFKKYVEEGWGIVR